MSNIRRPNPWPQTFFLSRPEREILYWWARGGGKTAGGIAFLSRWIDNPRYRALVLRHTFDDLQDWRDTALEIYTWLGATTSGKEIVFPSWAKIRCWFLKDQKSYWKYKGHEYQKILIEEITQIPSEELCVMLMWSNRSTVKGIRPQMIATTNPDWPWRLWVKRRFVDVIDPNTTYIWDNWLTRVYIPAKIQDNPVLMESDPEYLMYLKGIKDDQLRKARLEWDREAYDIKGWIYTAQIRQMRDEKRSCLMPYEPWLLVDTYWDLWVSDYTTIIFVQRYWKEVRIIDSYYNQGEWLEFYAQVLRDKKYSYGKHYAPHDIKVRELSTGKTRLDQAKEYWLHFEMVPPISIRDGINKARSIFAYCWFNSEKCKTLLEHLEIYRKERDETHQTFKNKPYHWPESHFADAFRYLAVSIDKEQKQYSEPIQVTY